MPNDVLHFCETRTPLRFEICAAVIPNSNAVLNCAITVPSVSCAGHASYIANTWRGISVSVQNRHTIGYQITPSIKLRFIESLDVTRCLVENSADSFAINKQSQTHWVQPTAIPSQQRLLNSDAIPLQHTNSTILVNARRIHINTVDLYSNSKAMPFVAKTCYVHIKRIPVTVIDLYAPNTPIYQTFIFRHNQAKLLQRQFIATYSPAYPLSPGRHVIPPLPNTTIPCTGLKLRFSSNLNPMQFKCFVRNEVSIKDVYFVTNSFSLIRISDSLPIKTLSFSMNIDVDSWAWAWNATIDPSQFTAVFSLDQLNPIDLLLTINGISFKLVVEKASTNRTFGSKGLSISGRSHAAYLASPYSAITTSFSLQAITARQAANLALTVNNVPIGWTIGWYIDDWLIANNAWSGTGTYIEHLTRIAESGGAYIQPHDTANTIKFLSYYPHAPWDWGDSVTNLLLPESIVTLENIDYSFKPDYTGVYVHGGASGGRLDLVKKTGTPGDNQAPIVVDDLATDPIMTRQRGLKVLGDTGTIAMVSLSLPILTETGIIRPGTIVKYTYGTSQSRYGIVRGVSIAYELGKVRQTIELETHEYL